MGLPNLERLKYFNSRKISREKKKKKIAYSELPMVGLENVNNKKIRIFKTDRRSRLKHFFSKSKKKSAILVMGWDLHKAFAISFDGLTKRAASIEAPSVNYIQYAHHALVKNELFVFGGIDEKRVGKIKKKT